jgi:predicted TIM-barrel fold metal-dependent hydrolase
MFRGAPVIDADSHKIENPLLFLEYVEPPYRDRLRTVVDQYGEQRVAIVDRHPRTGAADFVRLYPQPDGLGKGAYRALHPETAMGALYNRIRIEHMDREGIDAQVIYGSLTLVLPSLIDRDLAVALCHAYNNYIYDDCAAYRTRLIPTGVLPLQDVNEAVAEMRRCVERLGMPSVSISPNLPVPHPEAPEAFPAIRAARHLSDPEFVPLFEAAQELDVAVGIHGTPGAYLCGGTADQLDTFALVHLFGHRSQQQMAIAKLVMDGVFERFPKLRLGFLEAGCGWLPDLIHALHEHWEKRVRDFDPSHHLPRGKFVFEALRDRQTVSLARRARNLLSYAWRARSRPGSNGNGTASHADYLYEHRGLARDPREYFARGQIFTTFEPDDPAPIYLKTALGPTGERLAGWSVDYGHWDGVLKDCVKRVITEPRIDPEYAVRLLFTNTVTFYGRRLRERIDPLLRTQPLLIEGPPDAPREEPRVVTHTDGEEPERFVF